MRRIIPALSQGMLVLGVLLVLAGLGWGLWLRANTPPDPSLSDAGAVVLAVTAPLTSTVPAPTPTATIRHSSTPTSTSLPIRLPATSGPTPALLPEWEAQLSTTSTDAPPTPSRPPTPTPVPRAETPPTRIVASAIDLDTQVVPMGWQMVDRDGLMQSEWIVPNNAAGWHLNSALPGHGENVVLSGHHNIEGKVFRYVVDLEPGDEIVLYVGDTAYHYTVTEKYILKEAGMPLSVRQKNAQWIMPSGEERLTLVTCWPYEWPGNSHRVIVVARPGIYPEWLNHDQ